MPPHRKEAACYRPKPIRWAAVLLHGCFKSPGGYARTAPPESCLADSSFGRSGCPPPPPRAALPRRVRNGRARLRTSPPWIPKCNPRFSKSKFASDCNQRCLQQYLKRCAQFWQPGLPLIISALMQKNCLGSLCMSNWGCQAQCPARRHNSRSEVGQGELLIAQWTQTHDGSTVHGHAGMNRLLECNCR